MRTLFVSHVYIHTFCGNHILYLIISPSHALAHPLIDILPFIHYLGTHGLYIRAIYNDRDQIMAGCDGKLWCPYESFRNQLLKTSSTPLQYQKDCHSKSNASSTSVISGHHGGASSDKRVRYQMRNRNRNRHLLSHWGGLFPDDLEV